MCKQSLGRPEQTLKLCHRRGESRRLFIRSFGIIHPQNISWTWVMDIPHRQLGRATPYIAQALGSSESPRNGDPIRKTSGCHVCFHRLSTQRGISKHLEADDKHGDADYEHIQMSYGPQTGLTPDSRGPSLFATYLGDVACEDSGLVRTSWDSSPSVWA